MRVHVGEPGAPAIQIPGGLSLRLGAPLLVAREPSWAAQSSKTQPGDARSGEHPAPAGARPEPGLDPVVLAAELGGLVARRIDFYAA